MAGRGRGGAWGRAGRARRSCSQGSSHLLQHRRFPPLPSLPAFLLDPPTHPPTHLPTPQCDTSRVLVVDYWKQRTSLIVYMMAIVATLGWFLFMVFGAIGMVSIPVDFIRAFVGRPRAIISRAAYTERARDLARRARDIK